MLQTTRLVAEPIFFKCTFKKLEKMGGRDRGRRIPEFKDSLVYKEKPCLRGGKKKKGKI